MAEIPRLPVPSIAISGSELLFPVRRIYCVGRNYAEQGGERGGVPRGELPFFFSKPADAVVPSGWRLPFPLKTSDLHHEVELVGGLHQGGTNIHAADTSSMIYGYAVGIDLTRRDL